MKRRLIVLPLLDIFTGLVGFDHLAGANCGEHRFAFPFDSGRCFPLLLPVSGGPIPEEASEDSGHH